MTKESDPLSKLVAVRDALAQSKKPDILKNCDAKIDALVTELTKEFGEEIATVLLAEKTEKDTTRSLHKNFKKCSKPYPIEQRRRAAHELSEIFVRKIRESGKGAPAAAFGAKVSSRTVQHLLDARDLLKHCESLQKPEKFFEALVKLSQFLGIDHSSWYQHFALLTNLENFEQSAA